MAAYRRKRQPSDGSPMYSPDTTEDIIPILEIVEQPNDSLRFRYLSELSGTPHGPLMAQNSSKNKKVFPTVRLLNFYGEADIKCWLIDNPENPTPHVHRLVSRRGKQIIDEPHSLKATRENNFTVSFENLVILHAVQKDSEKDYYEKRQKWASRHKDCYAPAENNTKSIKEIFKSMEKNVVYLYFEAHVEGENYSQCLCSIVSSHIKNLKNPECGELKIFRQSHFSGSADGGEIVFIFVSKLPKDVRIEFFDPNSSWVDSGSFSPSDVHAKSAIAFKTPKFPRTIRNDTEVSFRLIRETDGVYSNSCNFLYKPSSGSSAVGKKRKLNSDDISNANQNSPDSTEREVDNSENSNVVVLPVYEDKFMNYDEIEDNFNSGPSMSSGELSANYRFVEEIYHGISRISPEDFIETDGISESFYVNKSEKNYSRIPVAQCMHSPIPVAQCMHSPMHSMHNPMRSNSVGNIGKPGPPGFPGNAGAKDDIGAVVPKGNQGQQGSRVFLILSMVFNIMYVIMRKLFSGMRKLLVRNIQYESSKLHKLMFDAVRSDNLDNFKQLFKECCKNQGCSHLFKHVNEESGKTVLQEAIIYQRPHIVKLILSQKSYLDLSITDENRNTLHHLAAERSSLPILKMICCCKLFLKNYDGMNCLHVAVEQMKKENVAYLASLFDLNAPESKAGNSPLHLAVENRCTDIVEVLIKAGASINCMNMANNTPLHLAVINKDTKMVKLLLENGADGNIPHGFLLDEIENNNFSQFLKNEISNDLMILSRNLKKDSEHNEADELLTQEQSEYLIDLLSKNDTWKKLAKVLDKDEHLIPTFLTSDKPAKMILDYIDLHRDEIFHCTERQKCLNLLDDMFCSIGLEEASYIFNSLEE